MMQNTPMGPAVGMCSPLAETCLKHVCFVHLVQPIMFDFAHKRVSQKSPYVYMYGPKCYYQNDRMVREKRLCFQEHFSFGWIHVTNKIPEVDFLLFKLACN